MVVRALFLDPCGGYLGFCSALAAYEGLTPAVLVPLPT